MHIPNAPSAASLASMYGDAPQLLHRCSSQALVASASARQRDPSLPRYEHCLMAVVTGFGIKNVYGAAGMRLKHDGCAGVSMGLAERTLSRVGRNLMPLTVLFLVIGVVIAAGRVYGVLPPPPEMSHEVAVLVVGAIFSLPAVIFGAMFWRFRSELYFISMLLFSGGVVAAMLVVHHMEWAV